jgi:hypothetical protein
MEARDERRLRALQKHLNTVKLLIVEEVGYVPYPAARTPGFLRHSPIDAVEKVSHMSSADRHHAKGTGPVPISL